MKRILTIAICALMLSSLLSAAAIAAGSTTGCLYLRQPVPCSLNSYLLYVSHSTKHKLYEVNIITIGDIANLASGWTLIPIKDSSQKGVGYADSIYIHPVNSTHPTL